MARPGMISVLVGVLSVVVFFANGVSPNPAAQDPPPNFRVAFFGDSWTESESPELFRMLKEERADMIVHAGDFTYSPDKTLIFRVVENTMGPNFPFVAVLGNHDLDEPHRGNQHSADPVSGYQPLLLEQTAKANVKCDEDPRGGAGAMQACYHQGLLVVNLSYRLKLDFWRGISATDYAKFIDDTFDANPNVRWRICNIHKPVKHKKTDLVVETCKKWGAIIANGHWHSYLRMHYARLDPVQSQVDGALNVYELGPGQSVQWVAGLGGADPDVLRRKRIGPSTVVAWPRDPSNDAVAGAVICEFNPHGQAPDQALCAFRDILRREIDTFALRSLTPADWVRRLQEQTTESRGTDADY